MKTFTDCEGRAWVIEAHCASLKRVRDLTGADPLDPETLLARLLFDPIFAADVLYAMCKPEADQRGITDEQFGRALAGDVLAKARDALIAELTDFFPEPSRRELLAAKARKDRRLQAAVIEALLRRTDETTDEDDLRRILSIAGVSSTSSPEPSASIPDP